MIDAPEAFANAAVGLVVSWLLTWAWLGFSPTHSAGITLVFFLASFTRAWIIRAYFRSRT